MVVVAAAVLVVVEEVVMVVLEASAAAAAVLGGGDGGDDIDGTKGSGGLDVLVRAAVVAAQVAHVPCGHAATFFTSTNSLGVQGVGQHDVQLNDSVDSCSTRANTAMTDRGKQAE